MKKLAGSLISIFAITLISVATFEAVVHISFAYPAYSIMPLDVMRKIYLRELRNVIQVDPACSRYDPYVSYTLKSGSCVFSNMGEESSYRINSAGLRDDEASLRAPAIIILGDSFSMGWGVEQDETFSELLEQASGKRVLNAGISSYGTAREMRLLERLDLAGAEYLVIQYCDNDIQENSQLTEHGEINITTQEKRNSVIKKNQQNISYHFGKYTLLTAWYAVQWLRKDKMFAGPAAGARAEGDVTADQEAKYYLNALLASKVDLSKMKIIVFEINDHNKNDTEFTGALKRISESGEYPDWIRSMKILDVSSRFTDDLYFVLDGHINAAGHRVLAEEIHQAIVD